jgi:preprotein translocase subunit SecG
MWIVIAVIALLAIIGVALLTNGGSGTGGGTGGGY